MKDLEKTKRKISKLNERDEDYFKPRALKERKHAVNGKPDLDDVYDLQKLFELYDKTTFGKLKRFCETLAVERALNNRDAQFALEHGKLDAKYVAFAMPQDLQVYLERYYPTLWTNPEHSRWFVKKFPMFRR